MNVHKLIECEEADIDAKDLEEMFGSSYCSNDQEIENRQENFRLNSLDVGLQMAF